jgi:pimeloyl-ACP methyl ester carboxylesterase
MRGEFIDVGGVRLYYYAAGSRGTGEPIILLHGFPTSGHLWSDLVPLLPKGHRVVVLDLLGFGRSDSPGAADLSLLGHATRVVRLMDALRIDRATLIGHHMGGAIAQCVAINWPARITRLGLVASTGFDITVTGTFALARAFLPLTSVVPHRLLLRAMARDLNHRYCDTERGRHSVEQYLRPFTSAGGHRSFLRHLSAFAEGETNELATRLTDVSVPVALVWGSDDAFVPPSLARRLRERIPRATLDIIDHVRHFTPEEAPERVATVVGELLRR